MGGDTPKASCRPYRCSVSESRAKYPVFAGGDGAPSRILVRVVCRRGCRVGMDRSDLVSQCCRHIECMRGQTYVHFVKFVLVGAPYGVHQVVAFTDDADCFVGVVGSLHCNERLANRSCLRPNELKHTRTTRICRRIRNDSISHASKDAFKPAIAPVLHVHVLALAAAIGPE